MEENILIADETIVITLLLIAVIASITLRHLKMPYTIGLVITGYILSSFIAPHISLFQPFEDLVPSSGIILYLFLPPLIFESAVALNTRLLSRNLFPVLGLAIPGVIISAVIIGLLVSHMFAMPLLFALLFGALISATDPAAVISLFKEIGVPKRLQILVEGESLLNDAAAIVMFQMLLTLITVSSLTESISFTDTAVTFTETVIISFFGGILVGALVGIMLRSVLKQTPLHPHIHQTSTLVAAYLAYLISDHLCGFSGVVAVVVCGCIAAKAASDWVGPAGRDELTRFWEYIGYLANSVIFLLVGIAIASLQDLSLLLQGTVSGIIILIAVVILARFIPVFGIIGGYNLLTPRKIPFSYQMISVWGGIRGAVAIALSLSLDPALPYRDPIIAFSVIIVLFTILVQGLTIGPLIHYFGLGQTELVTRFHTMYTDLVAVRAGIKGLQKAPMSDIIDPRASRSVIQRYQNEADLQVEKIRRFWDDTGKNPEKKSILRLFWLEALRYEQKQYRLLYDDGLIFPAVYAELQYQITTREELIQSGNYHPGKPEVGPGTRLRKRMQHLITHIAPASRISRYFRHKNEMNLILGAAAIVIAASQTSRYLTNLAQFVQLNQEEIADILEVYTGLEQKAHSFLHSDTVVQSGQLKGIGVYLAKRTAAAGIMGTLHQCLDDGAGDEKTLTLLMNRLLDEKNEAQITLIRACRDQPRI